MISSWKALIWWIPPRFTPSGKISKQVHKVRKEGEHLLGQGYSVQMVTPVPAAGEHKVFWGQMTHAFESLTQEF